MSTGADKAEHDGNNINSKLELKEFGDRVVHISTPHACLHNGSEVVIGQNDI